MSNWRVIVVGEEFEAYAWVKADALSGCALNEQTRATFTQLGVLMEG